MQTRVRATPSALIKKRAMKSFPIACPSPRHGPVRSSLDPTMADNRPRKRFHGDPRFGGPGKHCKKRTTHPQTEQKPQSHPNPSCTKPSLRCNSQENKSRSTSPTMVQTGTSNNSQHLKSPTLTNRPTQNRQPPSMKRLQDREQTPMDRA